MKRVLIIACFLFGSELSYAQTSEDIFIEMPMMRFGPQDLIEGNRVGGMGLINDGQEVLFAVSKVNIQDNKKYTVYYRVGLDGTGLKQVDDPSSLIADKHLSPLGDHKIVVKDEKMTDVYGTDFYPNLKESKMMIYDQLNYRHWDVWEDGAYSHLFLESIKGKTSVDIMKGESYDCPQKPFGGAEDYCWSPDGKSVLYVCKKKYGTEYAVSTNTDIYKYDLESRKTTNLTEGNLGYDTHPMFSSTGQLAWLQMKRDGYESDKNDLIIDLDGTPINLTKDWDGTVRSFMWSNDGSKIFFTAPVLGTVQLFEVELPKFKNPKDVESMVSVKSPKQLTEGQFDVRGIIGQSGNKLVLSRGDMLNPTELFTFNLKKSGWIQLTSFNEAHDYESCSVEKRMVPTTDGKEMLAWVIYPPNFNPNRKYPTILYCQGGPQGALSQFYSYRWNFRLMASMGYIVIAPNRRGMPGYGVEWNEQISKDYGGQNMQDYLSAIDDISKESYVDTSRLACVGASYGGYSAFYLSAIHDGRFKTFIAHDGIFNWKSMYGTTEEMFFVNWDLGGPYWDKDNKETRQSYGPFNPVEHVEKWDTPIMVIQGGKDYRVPIGQGLEAFQAAQLQGIKSKLLYFPDENHWVLDYQNSLIWHTEFYKWLDETLNGQ